MSEAEGTPKKRYEPPALEDWGSVAELTGTGKTRKGNDAKGGSAASRGK